MRTLWHWEKLLWNTGSITGDKFLFPASFAPGLLALETRIHTQPSDTYFLNVTRGKYNTNSVHRYLRCSPSSASPSFCCGLGTYFSFFFSSTSRNVRRYRKLPLLSELSPTVVYIAVLPPIRTNQVLSPRFYRFTNHHLTLGTLAGAGEQTSCFTNNAEVTSWWNVKKFRFTE